MVYQGECMKKTALMIVFIILVSSTAHAQWGDLINKVKSNPLVAQQETLRDLIAKAQAISSVFTQMPLNNGKLDFIKAALPLLTQTNLLSSHLLSSVQQKKTVDSAQTTQMSGLLDQVKELLAQQWSTTPLAANQIPQAKAQSQQITNLLGSILKNEGSALQALIPGLKN
jgi:hypothetical protein